ncbi:DUF421 domain-containing protein [Clostridium sp. YIM B02515]|uniref:DUF421 domain-containing protein n=1 Tax=Clostridium rhizosphaerae TaxID=2803861 RepID=A0ABS1TD38_9CLOT|nr:DUF421 domain-containing protein [Clostridium rhizosphaerae]MBL4937274.1 DUF421 domain-containing protein [Clostridium rhizosphaerae]
MNTYFLILIRTITIMSVTLFSILLIMGKRPIGELPVFDYLIIITLGSVVGADIAEPNINHAHIAFAIIILALFQKSVTLLALKSKLIKKLVTFEPTIVIKNGKFIYKNLKHAKYSIDEVLMLLREKDIFDINEVYLAILEPNGNLSALKHSQYETVTLKNMNIKHSDPHPPLTIIHEGNFVQENLSALKISKEEIIERLPKEGFNDYKNIVYASIDTEGNINISPYDYDGNS